MVLCSYLCTKRKEKKENRFHFIAPLAVFLYCVTTENEMGKWYVIRFSTEMSDVLGSIKEIVEAERRKLLGSFEKV